MATRNSTSPKKSAAKSGASPTASYQHSEAQAIIRPEAGAQTRFKKKKPTATWRYDSSLAPELQWDAQNPAREQGEARIAALQTALASMHATLAEVEQQLATAQPSQSAAELSQLLLQARAHIVALQHGALREGRASAADLKALSKPFLNWAGKAERLSFDGDKPVSAEGSLTLLGVTKPVTLTLTRFHCAPHPLNKRETCGADIIARLKRSEFGMTKYIPSVSDEVRLIIPVEAYKE